MYSSRNYTHHSKSKFWWVVSNSFFFSKFYLGISIADFNLRNLQSRLLAEDLNCSSNSVESTLTATQQVLYTAKVTTLLPSLSGCDSRNANSDL